MSFFAVLLGDEDSNHCKGGGRDCITRVMIFSPMLATFINKLNNKESILLFK